MACIALLFSCKKEPVETPAPGKPLTYKDSVSFVVSGKTYTFKDQHLSGTGNRQINLKPYPSEIDGRRFAISTGGFYYYGPADYMLYEAHYSFSSYLNEYSTIRFLFTKQYKSAQLRKDIHLLVPTDNSELLSVGKKSFAVDLDKENTTDGIALEVRLQDISSRLSTYIPGFSILLRTDLKKDLQDNSTFEITKCDKLKNGLYLVEGKFEVNLFNNEGKLYRLEKGFMRLVTDMKVYGVWL
jgi:hypothetical protein